MFRYMFGYAFLLLALKFRLSTANCDVASDTIAGGTFFKSSCKLCPGDLIFEDQFDSFNLAKWQHEITLAGGGNWEFQYYLNNRTNSYVQDGHLHIRPTFLTDDNSEEYLYSATLDVNNGAPADLCTNAAYYGCSRTGTRTNILNPIKSARIRTVESFFFRYGIVEVRAKMPTGDWLWPAIWLLPRYNTYGTWPASGEIDLLESRGNKNYFNRAGVNIGTEQVASTLHWGTDYFFNQYARTHFEKNNASGYNTDFHVYKLIWNSDGLEFFVDDKQIGSVNPPHGGFWELGEFPTKGLDNPWAAGSKMAPFDQQFYVLINLAVGGVNFFPEGGINKGGKPWLNSSPTAATDF